MTWGHLFNVSSHFRSNHARRALSNLNSIILKPNTRVLQPSHAPCTRWHSRLMSSEADNAQNKETVNVSHSQFLANAPSGTKWREPSSPKDLEDASREELEQLQEGKGKLLPTSSHLFKLILPLGRFLPTDGEEGDEKTSTRSDEDPPTVLLLHPSQPLSHVSRLIVGTLPSSKQPNISFRSKSAAQGSFKWSDSTDVGDFIKDAANDAVFSIHITYPRPTPQSKPREEVIEVQVPTFADRTRYLRRRLVIVDAELKDMEGLKKLCDKEAHRGAKRMAVGGFGMLLIYWGAVFRLTFYDYGWDVMEPVTYLSGLSTVVCGYLWFLYQGREVSYSSVLDSSISTRRAALYKARGLDIERWVDLVGERKDLKREITKIAEDYDRDSTSEDSSKKSDDELDDNSRDKKVAKQAREAKNEKGEDPMDS